MENPETWGAIERSIESVIDMCSRDTTPGLSLVRRLADLYRSPEMQEMLRAEEPAEMDLAADMLQALKAQHNAIDLLFAWLIQSRKDFLPSKSGAPWKALVQGNEVIWRAEKKA